MRGLFGIVSLLLVVSVVGFLAKKQLSPASGLQAPAVSRAAPGPEPSGTVQDQSRQIQQQFRAAAEAAAQQARPVADDK